MPICFEQPILYDGLVVKRCPSAMVLETCTDSDWSGDKETRKSTSSAVFLLNKNCVCSSSRSQRTISLSSGEAEYYSTVSAGCDTIYLSNIIKFCTYEKPLGVYLLTDSSAARGVLGRIGAGRIRHLSGQVLWMQQRVAQGFFQVRTVPTATNVAGLNTKALSRDRVKILSFLVGVVSGEFEGETDEWVPVGFGEYEALGEHGWPSGGLDLT